jgi:hypothetical protein
MVGDMRAHFVDTLLARLDGEVACIWVTVAMRTPSSPPVDLLRAQMLAVYRATPRLNQVWSEAHTCWRPIERTDTELAAAFEITEAPGSMREHVERALSRSIDLARDPGFRVAIHPLDRGGALVIFQLHHAIGDARALGLLLRRMFGEDDRPTREPMSKPAMTERNVLLAALKQPSASAGLLHASRRMLASRGVALRRDGNEIGAPRVASARFELPGGPRTHAGLFYAALAVTAARWTDERTGIVRLRVPVDLVREFEFEDVVANTCIAVPLELELAKLRAFEGGAVVEYVRAELATLIRCGAIWPALLETLLVARLAARAQLRAGARPGLIAARRTNTLVATYVGSLDDYVAHAPFAITGGVAHTPTWGANAFSLAGQLYVDVSGFAGLWSRETIEQFRDDMAEWLVARGATLIEVGP